MPGKLPEALSDFRQVLYHTICPPAQFGFNGGGAYDYLDRRDPAPMLSAISGKLADYGRRGAAAVRREGRR